MRYKQLSFLLLALALASCTKFLDVKPVDKFLDREVYSNSTTTKNALIGIYLNMAKPGMYGEGLSSTTTDVLAQYYNVSKTTDIFYGAARYNYNDANSVAKLAEIWGSSYAAILNTNLFLYNVQAADGVLGKDEKNWMLGEAHAIRAYVAFDLLRLFGPVYSTDSLRASIPYPVKPDGEAQAFLPANKVMDSVLNDLKQAATLLSNDPIRTQGVAPQANDNGDNFFRMRNRRMNYYSVMALTARVQLYRLNKSAALVTARSVIDEAGKFFPWVSPDAVASGVAYPDRVFSSEVISGLENAGMPTTHTNWFKNLAGSRANLLGPNSANLETIYDSYANDIRYRNWFAVDPAATVAVKTFFKYDVAAINLLYFRFQPLIRLSEMYYIVAECEPDLATAQTYFNTVLTNRGIPSVVFDANRQALIEKEYRKEFWGEGQLFFYYKRMNKTAIPSAVTTGNITMGTAQYVPPTPLTETEFR